MKVLQVVCFLIGLWRSHFIQGSGPVLRKPCLYTKINFLSNVCGTLYTCIHSSLQEEVQQAQGEVPSEATHTSHAQERGRVSTGHPSPSSSRGKGNGQAGKVGECDAKS